MPPSPMTRIWSASETVDSRWAIVSDVRCSTTLLNADRMWLSVIESRLEVASSYRTIGAFLIAARAIAMRCFSPPESFKPRSPTIVSYRRGMRLIIGSRSAMRAALNTSSSVAPGRPYRILCIIVSLNSTQSCGTTPM
mmetsp:Transcript_34800/g.91109  ORF Transcript_34800/g.91109 Transcript_34800/m.91109 type:complete len:138 (+) Transcript_34800:285-698(+)